MSTRYFAQLAITSDHVTLSGPEAHHLIHVMRSKPGDRVVLFDGSGVEFSAEVHRIDRSNVECEVLDRSEISRESSIQLTLAVALPKGDRQKWLVEKATELGVSRLIPLVTERSRARPTRRALARLQRTVIEASKQCGRNRLMEITSPESWGDTIASTAEIPRRLLAHPDGSSPPIFPSSTSKDTSAIIIAIGPEGGFVPDEVTRANQSGWKSISLGPRILRIETAALFLSALAGISVVAE